jgi:hypothetical protein
MPRDPVGKKSVLRLTGVVSKDTIAVLVPPFAGSGGENQSV